MVNQINKAVDAQPPIPLASYSDQDKEDALKELVKNIYTDMSAVDLAEAQPEGLVTDLCSLVTIVHMS